MDRRIAIATTIAIWVVGLFVLVRVIVPGLINMQNDGALIAAPMLLIGFAAAAYATWYKLFSEEEE